MKKIILTTIICLLIPCFGFAEGPLTISSIDGTMWCGHQLRSIRADYIPFDLQVKEERMFFGFADGEMYMCTVNDGDTCTPAKVPEEVNVLMMPVLGIVVTSLNGGVSGYDRSVSRTVITMLRNGLGYMTEYTRAWSGEDEPRGFIRRISGVLACEDQEWSP